MNGPGWLLASPPAAEPLAAAPEQRRGTALWRDPRLRYGLGGMALSLLAVFGAQALWSRQAARAAPAPVAPLPAAAVAAAPVPAAPLQSAAAPGTAPPGGAAAAKPATSKKAPSASRAHRQARAAAAKKAPDGGHAADDEAEAAARPAISIVVHGRRPEARILPAVMRGWNAFQAGDMAAAQAAYQRAMEEEPRNVDALHGLAAIAGREGKVDEARGFYQRILEIDPRNSAAAVALASLAPDALQDEPVEEESRLQTLAAGDTAAASVRFALGDLYARQGRWVEAEQSFFAAASAEPENPDYRYNLAVSLDQLGKPDLAASNYREALSRTVGRAASFDTARVRARLAELGP